MTNEQYDSVCRDKFAEIKDDNNSILSGIDDIKHRLFVDNGNDCLQTRINSHGKWIRNFMYILGGLWAVVVLVIFKVISHFGGSP